MRGRASFDELDEARDSDDEGSVTIIEAPKELFTTREDEKERLKKVRHRALLHDTMVFSWSVGLLAVSLYFLVSVTLDDTFASWSWSVNLPIDIFCIVYYAVDIVIRFGVTSPSKLCTANRRYVQKWFVVDLLSTIPIDLVVLLITGDRGAHRALMHLHLVRFFHMPFLFDQPDNEAIGATFVRLHYRVLPLVLTLFWILAISHLLITVHVSFVLKRPEGDALDCPWETYVTSTYFVLYTVTTVGYGGDVEGVSEMGFAIFLCLCGTIANAAIIGRLGKMIMAHDIRTDRRMKMVETLAVMEYFSLPSSLQQEVLAFQNHNLQHNMTQSYEQILRSLPQAMRQHISLYVRLRFIESVEMFKRAPGICKNILAETLVNVVFAPDQCIIEEGETLENMYFMYHGYADILDPIGQLVRTVKKGDYFGEVALLAEWRAEISVRTLTYCDCFQLNVHDFERVLMQDLEFLISVVKNFKQRVQGLHRGLVLRPIVALIDSPYSTYQPTKQSTVASLPNFQKETVLTSNHSLSLFNSSFPSPTPSQAPATPTSPISPVSPLSPSSPISPTSADELVRVLVHGPTEEAPGVVLDMSISSQASSVQDLALPIPPIQPPPPPITMGGGTGNTSPRSDRSSSSTATFKRRFRKQSRQKADREKQEEDTFVSLDPLLHDFSQHLSDSSKGTNEEIMDHWGGLYQR
eukprot:Sspe_Gene.71955::Locus_42779_Transcript_1_1_Confidence_1.000_Length_2201::g.71955::m.71955